MKLAGCENRAMTRLVLIGVFLISFAAKSADLRSLSSEPRPIDGQLLGATETELQAAYATVRRLPRPLRGPHGPLGLWMLPDASVSGLPFETTFYLKDKRVNRMEQRRLSPELSCDAQPSFAILTSGMNEKYGAGVSSNDTADGVTMHRSAAWAAEAFNVVVRGSQTPGQCSILVIHETRVAKDACEL
jgi:hypothetical protein